MNFVKVTFPPSPYPETRIIDLGNPNAYIKSGFSLIQEYSVIKIYEEWFAIPRSLDGKTELFNFRIVRSFSNMSSDITDIERQYVERKVKADLDQKSMTPILFRVAETPAEIHIYGIAVLETENKND